MLYFENDYCEGAHPAILQKLVETNFEKVSGYGTDPYCASAREKIRAACGAPDADVWFISGGTQSNAIVIASMLRRWEGVLAASTGHVAAHEAGAIEFTGHKVIGLPHTNGKLDAGTVEDWCRTFYADGNVDHLVFPGMAYISHPSEYGTLYTKAEMEALSAVCHKYHMPLFMDGARLGYGLAAEGTDVTLADVARLTDVFYIGGTKVGALCGEAVCWASSSMCCSPMTCTRPSAKMPLRPPPCSRRDWPKRAIRSSWIRPRIRCSSCCPTSSWPRWKARPSSASGRSTMIPTPLSALPPAGPPGWKRWSSCWS